MRELEWGGYFLLLLPTPINNNPGCSDSDSSGNNGAINIVATTCFVSSTDLSLHRQCMQGGISSPQKELVHRPTEVTERHIGLGLGGESRIDPEHVTVLSHTAAGVVVKIRVGERESDRGMLPGGRRSRGQWATRVLVHY